VSIVADQRLLAQVAPRADEHSKTKNPLLRRPHGPHPYPQPQAGTVRARDAGARQLLSDYSDDSSAVARLASWIGAAV
jgi:hypothetical protein